MLALSVPNTSLGVGEIMITGGGGKAWFYSPATTNSRGYRPTLTSAWAAFGGFHVTGTQLNGLTNGADIGDDGKMTIPDSDRQNLAKFLTISRARLDNLVARLKSGRA